MNEAWRRKGEEGACAHPTNAASAHRHRLSASMGELSSRNRQPLSNHTFSDGLQNQQRKFSEFASVKGTKIRNCTDSGVLVPTPVRPRLQLSPLTFLLMPFFPSTSPIKKTVWDTSLNALNSPKEEEAEATDTFPSEESDHTGFPLTPSQTKYSTFFMVEPELETPNRSTITSEDTVREFFSIGGSNLPGDSLASFGIASFSSSCTIGEEYVIDLGAAMSFRRSGARRARPAGPGFDSLPLS